jgi:Ca2+-binding RTX toxin-like protein
MAVFRGTDGIDNLVGTAADDRFIASLGDDIIDGGDGIDTLDFFTLRGQPITLLVGIDFVRAGAPPSPPQPIGISRIQQGDSTTEQRTTDIRNIERIIAPVGQTNVLNGSSILRGRGSTITVDLEAKTLKAFSDVVETLEFTVENFRNVIGADFSDTLVGDRRNNVLKGGSGIDTLSGAGGNDHLIGGTNTAAFVNEGTEVLDGGSGNDILEGSSGQLTPYPAERDLLTGGTGADRFVLGDGTLGTYYTDQFSANYPTFAQITDLSRRDTIQLAHQNTYGILLKENGFDLSAILNGQADVIAQVTYGDVGGRGSAVLSRFTRFVNELSNDATFTIGAGEVLAGGLLTGV